MYFFKKRVFLKISISGAYSWTNFLKEKIIQLISTKDNYHSESLCRDSILSNLQYTPAPESWLSQGHILCMNIIR
ncbi:hypothetical protein BpHYR1_034226 [Brachionus plicatilis]|uniref:Uncharacterized protein n=1 Tax=Brachionus plicatilis TaxID=10195 RepID=A0A3M7R1I5_BRAPC|nr:hypothetical protein BpHYR1_034226 [Brachionus plicatilis]